MAQVCACVFEALEVLPSGPFHPSPRSLVGVRVPGSECRGIPGTEVHVDPVMSSYECIFSELNN